MCGSNCFSDLLLFIQAKYCCTLALLNATCDALKAASLVFVVC